MLRKLNVSKASNIYDFAGCWFLQFGRYADQYIWYRDSKGTPYLLNEITKETYTSANQIKKLIKLKELEPMV